MPWWGVHRCLHGPILIPFLPPCPRRYEAAGRQLPAGCWGEVLEGLKSVEAEMGARLGDPTAPLLLSVRSGAAVRRRLAVCLL